MQRPQVTAHNSRPKEDRRPTAEEKVATFNAAYSFGAAVLVTNGRNAPRPSHTMGPAKLVTLAVVQVSGLGWVPVDQVKPDTSAGTTGEGAFEEDLGWDIRGARDAMTPTQKSVTDNQS